MTDNDVSEQVLTAEQAAAAGLALLDKHHTLNDTAKEILKTRNSVRLILMSNFRSFISYSFFKNILFSLLLLSKNFLTTNIYSLLKFFVVLCSSMSNLGERAGKRLP